MYEYTFTRKRVTDAAVITSNPADVVKATRSVFDGAESERLVVVALSTRNEVLGFETVYMGNVSGSQVRVGEVFRLPIRLNAKSLIVLHNHPSGFTKPGPDDIYLTHELVKAGKLLDIEVLDHIVVGHWGAYESMRDTGVLMP